MKRPTNGQLIEAIENARGNVSAVARAFGRPRSTVQSWIDNSKTATRTLEDARETRVDVAETIVYKAATEGTLQAAFYILNNDPRAKRRGWGPRQEVEHSGPGGEVIRVRVQSADD